MGRRRKPPNPFCSVAGCNTKQPHTDDFLVKALVERFATPTKCLDWVLAGMAELRDSVADDVQKGRLFSWFTRMRQPEELYFRTLYVLFLATEEEVPHILSGDMPNSFSDIYVRVNTEILEGRGEITEVKPGLISGEFRVIDTLNDGAHVGFGALQMVANFGRYPEYVPDLSVYLKHVNSYCTKINYMKSMFGAGKPKDVVLEAIQTLHKPQEYWEQKSREAKDEAEGGGRDVKPDAARP